MIETASLLRCQESRRLLRSSVYYNLHLYPMLNFRTLLLIFGLCLGVCSCFRLPVLWYSKRLTRYDFHSSAIRASASSEPMDTYRTNNNILERRPLLLNTLSSATGLLLVNPDNSAFASAAAAAAAAGTPQQIQLPGSSKPFPIASFGLQIYSDDMAYTLTLLALEAGFRNFFASVLANNQRGFARAIKDSGIPRKDLYICGSVLSHRVQGEERAYRKTKQGCIENIMTFSTAGNIDYLDMIMLDYPGPDGESIRGQWRAFEEMKNDGLVESLAVSNFSPEQLDSLYIYKGGAAIQPVVNQLPYSIANHPKNMIEYNAQRGIVVQSWSPLSTTLPKYKVPLEIIGKRYGKNAAQVALRWIIQTGATFCVQSKSEKHFKEDLDVFDFSLSDREVFQLSQLQPPLPLLNM